MRLASFQELAAHVGAVDTKVTAQVWVADGLTTWQARAGACLLIHDATHDRNHLRAILTDPDKDGMVLTVGFSTIRDERHDRSCTIMPGEHPFARVPSFATYGHARMISAELLAREVQSGKALAREPLSRNLLCRLREGLPISRFTPAALLRRFGGRA